MKILAAEKIREADAFTIKHEPIAPIDLMERAATSCFHEIKKIVPQKDKTIHIVAGPGNNGGDGLVIARLLAKEGYPVKTHIIWYTEKASESFGTNLQRLQELTPNQIFQYYKEEILLPEIKKDEIVIDALFGNGLSRPATGISADCIKTVNESHAAIIAIDVPSGMYIDKSSKENQGNIIKADYTLTFAPPKLGFFVPENDIFIGKWKILDIGLMPEFIESTKSQYQYLSLLEAVQLLRERRKFSHKGTFGHSLILAGSKGKTGAAVLAARAALRSGAGLVSLHIPSESLNILQTSIPEAMVSIDETPDIISCLPDISKYSAIAIGPGIGTEKPTAEVVKRLIQESRIPIIFDADAINILAENPTWLKFLPANSIFSPHPGEFKRLVGNYDNDFERLEMQKSFCISNRCWMILKGAHSSICSPSGQIWFNDTGNPGMATGGSGDVLTGILAGLFAQGYNAMEVSLLGTCLHGLAGDLALENESEESLIAGDIVENLGKAFAELRAIRFNQKESAGIAGRF